MYRRFLAYLGLVLILFVLPITLVSRLRDIATSAVAPIGHFFLSKSTGLRNTVNNFSQLDDLRNQNTDLQAQVISLQEQLIELNNVKQENEDLRKQIGVTGVVHDTTKVLAQVSLYNNADPLDPTFTISAGSTAGIKVGQPAVYQGVLVGRVISVRDHSSVVRSVRSQKSLIQAAIDPGHNLGVVTGTGSGVTINYVNQGVTIAPKSIVETSGLGGTLPQGILIGSTGDQLSAKNDTSQTFSIDQVVEPSSIQSLFVLLVDTVWNLSSIPPSASFSHSVS